MEKLLRKLEMAIPVSRSVWLAEDVYSRSLVARRDIWLYWQNRLPVLCLFVLPFAWEGQARETDSDIPNGLAKDEWKLPLPRLAISMEIVFLILYLTIRPSVLLCLFGVSNRVPNLEAKESRLFVPRSIMDREGTDEPDSVPCTFICLKGMWKQEEAD